MSVPVGPVMRMFNSLVALRTIVKAPDASFSCGGIITRAGPSRSKEGVGSPFFLKYSSTILVFLAMMVESSTILVAILIVSSYCTLSWQVEEPNEGETLLCLFSLHASKSGSSDTQVPRAATFAIIALDLSSSSKPFGLEAWVGAESFHPSAP